MKRTLIVGGTFDSVGGRASSIMSRFLEIIPNSQLYNGGYYEELKDILKSTVYYDIVIWMPNVSNTLPKIRNVKSVNQKCILITSKRNDNNKYFFKELVNMSLKNKANLTIEIVKEQLFKMRLYDPLGNVWCEFTNDMNIVIQRMYDRATELSGYTRAGTIQGGVADVINMSADFLEIIHNSSQVFHDLIMPAKDVKRFLGNASFRCMKGFPSHRGVDGQIYVSKRNIDKSDIDNDGFVKVWYDGGIKYAGDSKPSVDTPIQMALYDILPNINYMLHSHVYIKDAVFTDITIPCGALEEIQEIVTAINQNKIDTTKGFCINLRGHGSIVFANELSIFNNIEYKPRRLPESQ